MAQQHPITLYTAGTPNGWKASVTLEELGIPYNTVAIDISKNTQKEPWFIKINPNGRIPAIVDHSKDDFAVFETGAIMEYLCDNYDSQHRLLPQEPLARSRVIQFLMFQMGGVGPMQGQANHFVVYAPEKIPYAQKRYLDETKRLYGVLEIALEGQDYLANNQYSIADIANYSWVKCSPYLGIKLDEFPRVKKWVERIDARPAVQKGIRVPNDTSVKRLEDALNKL
ncbi:glutathione S-transferase [Umbelopsis sp. PMI_123]|nr:glutathione S-transferase [Umbelopsis sp. PMI_123]